MKSLARLKDQVKSLLYKILKNEIDFHRLFDSFRVLHNIFQVKKCLGVGAEWINIKLHETAKGLITRCKCGHF